jgi:hypothetical protein
MPLVRTFEVSCEHLTPSNVGISPLQPANLTLILSMMKWPLTFLNLPDAGQPKVLTEKATCHPCKLQIMVSKGRSAPKSKVLHKVDGQDE